MITWVKNHQLLFLVLFTALIWALTGHNWSELSGGFLFFGGIDFDGDDFVGLGSGSSIRVTGPLSIGIWVKTSSSDTGEKIALGWHNPGQNRGWFLEMRNNRAEFFIGDGNARRLSSGVLINDNKWHLIVGVHDGVTTMSIYVDGILRNSRSTGGTVTAPSVDPAIGAINSTSPLAGFCWPGLLNECFIYNFALDVKQNKELYSQKRKYFPRKVQKSNLQGFWPMDDGSDGTSADGAVVRDLSGNGNHGTGDNGANNLGLTWKAEDLLSYPPSVMPLFIGVTPVLIPILLQDPKIINVSGITEAENINKNTEIENQTDLTEIQLVKQ